MRILLLLIFSSLSLLTVAQPFQISGRVTDEDLAEGVPFCNVFVKGQSIGAVTDVDGYYTLTLNAVFDSLGVSAIGYKTQVKALGRAAVQQLDFSLSSSSLTLQEIVVVAGENPANEIVRNIIKNKSNNRLDSLAYWQCENYTKVELDFHNIKDGYINNRWLEDFSFLYNFVDSVSDEKPFLPIFIKETIADVLVKKGTEKAVAKALQESGVGNASVLRFMDKMHQPYNVYDNRINILEKPLVSPFANSGLFYYEYYIEDSATIAGQWCYRLRFKPKRKQENTFFGDFWVADKTFAVVRVNMQMSRDVNINFVERVIIFEEYGREADRWLLAKKKMVLDFAPTKEAPGLIGRKTDSFRKYEFDAPDLEARYKKADPNDFDLKQLQQSEEFWQTARHDTLSKNETQVYVLLDSIKNTPIYDKYYNGLMFLTSGFVEVMPQNKSFGPLKIGPVQNTYYTNIVERNHFQVGAQADFRNRTMRLDGRIGYGTRDEALKYFVRYRWKLEDNPLFMLGASYLDDVVLANRNGEDVLIPGFLNTSFRRDLPMRLMRAREAKVWGEKFWNNGISTRITLLNRYLDPYGGVEENGTGFNFQFLNATGGIDTTAHTTEAVFRLRYSFKDKRVNGNFSYVEFGSSKYPVVMFTYTAGVSGILGSDFNYHRLNLRYSHWIYTNPFGWFSYKFELGQVFSETPLPMLLLEVQPGNDTYINDVTAFNVMNRYEFVSDRYASWYLAHHFDGYFLNKIPLLKRLAWREFVTFSGVWGTLSDGNLAANSLNTSDVGGTIPFRSPSEMPYMEVGVGLENIFKVFQIHALWRLNYLDNPEAQRFMLQGGFYFSF